MTRSSLFHLFLIPALLAIMPAIGSAGIYTWVDEQGRRHYGDQIPPKQIQRSHKQLDAYGRTIKEIEAQKTREQLLEERRQAAIEAEAERLRQLQLTRDRTLLSTFSRVEQIDKLRDDRVALIDSNIAHSRKKMGKIYTQLDSIEQRKRYLASHDRPPSKQLELNILEYNHQLRSFERQIGQNLQLREEVITKFQQDRQRFIELEIEIANREKLEGLTEF